MTWTYCEHWNRVLNKPLSPFGESEARRRHESGDLYTAVDARPDGTRILIEVRLETGYSATRFVDGRGRDELAYVFMRKGDKLFLQDIISYTYGDEQGARGLAPLVVESCAYTSEGIVRHEIDDLRVETIAVTDYDSVDVTSHWEPIPEFGSYESISRYERD
ncbi:hypothetical protein [Actinokineospora xionganensis]|uniref:Uncharacterized protein n=1 Tax=Actinokineospora xionganensis TaxID=2684470 RepID=A0ABR7L3V2_9PSEU|nr:hypothetical protein [Actinokineospora xionganensis]MBC6447365.1 hypothetical protein [Actinokineospora xionganensis]